MKKQVHRSFLQGSFRVAVALAVMIAAPISVQGADAGKQLAGAAPGSHANPIEISLPIDLQASFFHSLPIAGHMVTPDQVAQLVIPNPRLRVTAGLPYSGKGTAYPIHQSGVADTHADPLAAESHDVRGAGRAPKP